MKNKALIPNLLTAYRLAVVPFLLYCLQPDVDTVTALVGFSIYATAAVTDSLDGYYARKWNVQSNFGKLMDPLADKILVATVLIMLIPMGRVSALIVLIILAREFLVTGLRGVAASTGMIISASKLGKGKAFIQILAMGTLMFPLGVIPIGATLHVIGTWLLYAALFLTVASGLDYTLRFMKNYDFS